MASKLAILLAAPSADEDDNPNADAVEWCDHKLQEVREVLTQLAERPFPVGEPCWCRLEGEHSEACQRARVLYEKLAVK